MTDKEYSKRTIDVLNFFNKVDNDVSYNNELVAIKNMDEETKTDITRALLDRAMQEAETPNKYISALKALEYLDPKFVDDFEWMISIRSSNNQYTQQTVEKIKQILNSEPYGKTMNEHLFWQRIANIAIGTRDNSLLAPVINRIESLK